MHELVRPLTELRPLRNPANVLREDAVIFHRDVKQALLTGDGYHYHFHHTGEMGDIIAALPIFRHLGGVHLTIGNHPLVGWRKMSDGGYKTILPLLKKIPCIKSVTWSDHCPPNAFNMAHFRESYKHDQTLTASQADYVGVPHTELDMSKWIDIKYEGGHPSKSKVPFIAIARSERYHNPAVNWRKLVDDVRAQHNKPDALLLGTATEFLPDVLFFGTAKEFAAMQYIIPEARHCKTKDFLDLARKLKYARAFIGNQSGPWWLARAMGLVTHQETHDYIRDSIVGGPNAHYHF